jgi:single-strand DNA-binding protein
MNNCVISGTLGKPVKITKLDNGTSVLNNTICIQEKDDYTWINIVAYAELAEKIIEEDYQENEYVIIQGKLKTRSWEKDGDKRYITEVLIYRIEGVD